MHVHNEVHTSGTGVNRSSNTAIQNFAASLISQIVVPIEAPNSTAIKLTVAINTTSAGSKFNGIPMLAHGGFCLVMEVRGGL